MLGPSGSGKTTMLRMIAGFEEPDRGTVELRRQATSPGCRPTTARSTPSSRTTRCSRTCASATTSSTGCGCRRSASEERGRGAAARRWRWCASSGYDERKPSELSGGQRQRVALARAIVNRPRVLLLDEPLGALDLKLREQLQIELKQIQREVGITFVYVTHDQEEALTMSDRIAVFNEGRIEQVGDAEDVYERPGNPFVAGFVGISNVIERDGDSFTVRPEKVRLLDERRLRDGCEVEGGTIRDVSYAGMVTRFHVELDAGGRIQVARQNLETTSRDEVATAGTAGKGRLAPRSTRSRSQRRRRINR